MVSVQGDVEEEKGGCECEAEERVEGGGNG